MTWIRSLMLPVQPSLPSEDKLSSLDWDGHYTPQSTMFCCYSTLLVLQLLKYLRFNYLPGRPWAVTYLAKGFDPIWSTRHTLGATILKIDLFPLPCFTLVKNVSWAHFSPYREYLMQIGTSWPQLTGQRLEVQPGYKSCRSTSLFQCLINYLY